MPGKQEIRAAVAATGGIATRRELLDRLPPAAVDSRVRRGWLTRVFPHTYVCATTPVSDHLRLLAALRHAGRGAVVSHTTALAWYQSDPVGVVVHLTIEHGRRLHGSPSLVVHRQRDVDGRPPRGRTVRGVLLTDPARTVIDAWPLLPPSERRPATLAVVRTGLTTAALIGEALGGRANVPGHRELRRTIDLIADGVRSELEALGVLGVFHHPDLPTSRGQQRVDVGDRRFYLDRCWPEVRLAVELDGAAHHTSPKDRQDDLERDRLLATQGWLVLRFTYADVVRNPDEVRRQVLAVYRARLSTTTQP